MLQPPNVLKGVLILSSKSVATKPAFIQHLKSPTHRNEKLQCMNCLRYFATATALTQHSESQGVRCTVRHTSGFDAVIDNITGGTAQTAGRHKDDTVKYVVNPALRAALGGAQGVIDAHKAAVIAKEERFKNHWDARTPKW